MQYVKKAQKILGSKLDRMTPADWRIVGLALIEGKSANDNDFNAWKLENGFGELTRDECSEALWLANDDNWDFFSKPQLDKGWNVRSARRLKNELERNENGAYTTRILAFMQPKKVYTSEEIADAIDLTSDRVSKRMYDLKKDGRVISAGKAQYQLTPASMQKPIEKDTAMTGAGMLRLFSRFKQAAHDLHKLFMETEEKTPYLKSMAPSAKWVSGKPYMQLRPMAPTWEEGVENTKDVPDGCVGWAKGIRYRMTVEPVWVPVNAKGESKDELAKRRTVK